MGRRLYTVLCFEVEIWIKGYDIGQNEDGKKACLEGAGHSLLSSPIMNDIGLPD